MINPHLPLIDLHRHLDGNIRAQTIWERAQTYGMELPVSKFEGFIAHVQIQSSEPGLMPFLEKLEWGVKILKTLEDCRRIAFENVEDALRAGIDYTELRFSPYFMARHHQLPLEGVVEAVIDGVRAGVEKWGVKVNLIGILSRTFGAECCLRELEALLSRREDLVAIDLAGDEENFPAPLFKEHFKRVADAGLHVTIHAGEASGAQSIWQAIRELGAERIGHGVHSCGDEGLLDYLLENDICIECCLTSNFQTETVRDLTKHPLRLFLERGMKVCLNTDDPAVQGIEIKDEYRVAQEALDLSPAQIFQLQSNALAASFLSDAEKRALEKSPHQKQTEQIV